MHYTYSFEKLEVWQKARTLRKEIYELTKSFPKEELYGLTSQIKRSIGSVTANLVKGSGRASDKDRAHFTNMAYTSALETIDHLIAAFDLTYITEQVYLELRVKMDELINKLNAFYKYQAGLKGNLKNRLLSIVLVFFK